MALSKDQIDLLPTEPGVYLMKDAEGAIIYVGKAIDIRKRIRGHLQHGGHAITHAAAVEYVLTRTESEALLLENNLIKRHKPRYNVLLRDDKKFPFIKMTAEDFPRFFLTRTRARDGSRYFGPYPSVKPARMALRAIKEIFPIRTCEIDSRDLKLERACIEYEMKRCVAPCIGKVTADEYRALCRHVGDFLSGNYQKVIRELDDRMRECAAGMRYEQAAYYRDMAASARRISEGKRLAETPGDENEDFLGYARLGDVTCVVVLKRTSGKIRSSEHYFMDETGDATEAEVLEAFISQYYAAAETLPRVIGTGAAIEEADALARAFTESSGRRIDIHHVQRGPRRRVIEMAATNARFRAEERYVKRHGLPGRMQEDVLKLGELLGLDRVPVRIEGYDISNVHGEAAVGSMVVFINGKPYRNGYRRFRIKEVQGIDDYAMMEEVLHRRLDHLPDYARDTAEEKGDIGPKPDLILIDGGQGHFNRIRDVFRRRGVTDIELASLAKQEEMIFTVHRRLPIRLREDSGPLKLLQNVRDESHRFAITYHRAVRGKSMSRSVLDAVPGIGVRRRAMLLKRFGSVEGIRLATRADLLSLPGISESLADAILEAVRGKSADEE